jgi:hypothetical protein
MTRKGSKTTGTNVAYPDAIPYWCRHDTSSEEEKLSKNNPVTDIVLIKPLGSEEVWGETKDSVITTFWTPLTYEDNDISTFFASAAKMAGRETSARVSTAAPFVPNDEITRSFLSD